MDDTHYITAEDCKDPVEVQRIDDNQGAIIALTKDFYGNGEDDDDFSVYFSVENARKLGEVLVALTAK